MGETIATGDLQQMFLNYNRKIIDRLTVGPNSVYVNAIPLSGVALVNDQYAGMYVYILTGQLAGYWRRIDNNTQNYLIISPDLPIPPATGDKLLVVDGASVSDAAVTDPTLTASEVALLKGLLKQLQGTGPIVSPVDVSDRAARSLGVISAADGNIASIGAKTDTAITDPTLSASEIALLKGLLKQLQGQGPVVTPVSLYGRNVQPTISVWSPSLTGFDPGVQLSSAVTDLSMPPGILGLGFAVDSDQPMEVEYCTAPAGGTASVARVAESLRLRLTLPATANAGCAEFIPPFRPIGGRYRIYLTNRGSAVPTRCNVYTYAYRDLLPQAQNLRALLARNLEIRDTSQHTFGTDPNNLYILIRFVLGGGKVPIYVYNGLNQAVDITIILRLGGVNYDFILGTKQVPAGGATVITNADFPGIDVPSEVIQVNAKCSIAPSSGALNAWIDSLIGGV